MGKVNSLVSERIFIITKLNEKRLLDKNCKSGVGEGGGEGRREERRREGVPAVWILMLNKD